MIEAAGELKTKPTQHSVNELRRIGISPDVVVCRSSSPLSRRAARQDRALRRPRRARRDRRRGRAATSTSCRCGCASSGSTISCSSASGSSRRLDLSDWERPVRSHPASRGPRPDRDRRQVRAAARRLPLGVEALKHARDPPRHATSRSSGSTPRALELDEAEERLRRVDGILIPGGFGPRAIEGKVAAVRYARESGTPFLGICLGMQCAVVEFARNVVRLADANSTEFDPETPYPVVDLLPEQRSVEDMGGTMRLGARARRAASRARAPTPPTARRSIYERHRHRYEVNNATCARSSRPPGCVVSGVFAVEEPRRGASSCRTTRGSWPRSSTPSSSRRPTRPQPLFRDFVGAAVAQRDRRSPAATVPARRPRPWRSRPTRCSSCSSSSRASRAHPAASARSSTCCVALPARSRARVRTRTTPPARSAAPPATSTAASPRRAGETGTPIFFCAHTDTVPHDGADRARRARRRRDERGGRRSSAPTTRRPSPAMLDAVRRIVAEGTPARRHRARADARRRRSACAAPRRSTTTRLQARIGYVFDHAVADRRHGARGAEPVQHRRDASSGARRTPASRRRRAAARSPPRRARSPRCGSAASTTRRPRTSALIARRQSRATSSPGSCTLSARGALARSREGARGSARR